MILRKHLTRLLGPAAAVLVPLALTGCGGGGNGWGAGSASPTPTLVDPFSALRYALTGQVGSGGAGQLSGPYGVARDAQGDLYVTEVSQTTHGQVVKFDPSGSFVTQFGTNGTGALTEPEQIAVDAAGDVYVADYANGQAGAVSRVVKYDPAGNYLAQFGASGTPATGQLSFPVGVAVDGQGDVFVTDGEAGSSQAARVVEFDRSGAFVKQFGTSGTGMLTAPEGLALDAAGNVYVADFASGQTGAVSRVVEFDSTGLYKAQFGAGQLASPQGVAMDPRGNVYVSDDANDAVDKFSPAGALLASFDTAAPGGGASDPLGLALNGAGDVYVADGNTNSIAELQPQPGAAAAVRSSAVVRVAAVHHGHH